MPVRCVGSCRVIGALLHGFQCFLRGLQLTHRATQCHCTPLGEQTVCWSSCGCDRMRLTWTRITLRRVSMMGFKKFSVPRHCHVDMWWRCGVGRAHAGVFASGQACPLSSVACRRRELNTSLTSQGHQPYYCSLDWVKSGGRFCEMLLLLQHVQNLLANGKS